jgi:hypothetical protein
MAMKFCYVAHVTSPSSIEPYILGASIRYVMGDTNGAIDLYARAMKVEEKRFFLSIILIFFFWFIA